MNTVLVVTVATYLAINIYPTIKTVKTGENQELHRLYKIFVIWLIPFVGGLAISLMYIIDPTYGRGPYDVGNGYYENDGSDFGGDGGGFTGQVRAVGPKCPLCAHFGSGSDALSGSPKKGKI